MKKERNSNIELLRVFAMLMIIAYHIFYHGAKWQLANSVFSTPEFYKKLLIWATISTMGQISNAIFILISGYFLVKKVDGINLKKIFFKLVSQLGFVALLLVIASPIFYFFVRYYKAGVYIELVNISIFNTALWFVGYYFIIIVLGSLFLNKFLNKLDRNQYVTFLIIIFSLTQFHWVNLVISGISTELSMLFIGIFLYSLGGYIEKYNPFEKIKTTIIIVFIIFIFFILTLVIFVLLIIIFWKEPLALTLTVVFTPIIIQSYLVNILNNGRYTDYTLYAIVISLIIAYLIGYLKKKK